MRPDGVGAHVLRGVKRTSVPRVFYIIDTETRPDETGAHRLVLGWACRIERRYGRPDTLSWMPFTRGRDLYAWITRTMRDRERAVLTAHNLVFDLAVTNGLAELASREWIVNASYSRNRVFCARVKGPGSRSLWLIDNLNYCKTPLSELGRLVGIEKREIDFGTCDTAELSAYCRVDTEILVAWWQRWIGEIVAADLGPFGLTTAAQAMSAFRRRGHPGPGIHVHTCKSAMIGERAAYFGGRNECFRVGEVAGPLTLFDVRAFYPSVMKTTRVPTKLIATRGTIQPAELADRIEGGDLAIAIVDLETDRADYPLRTREHGIIYPTGRFTTALSTPELCHALERGRIARVRYAALYEGAVIFAGYVEEMYARRRAAIQAGDLVTAEIYKLLANALYGKFGQKRGAWETLESAETFGVDYTEIIDAETGRYSAIRQIGHLIQIRSDTVGETRHSCPGIPAHITSAGRVRILELIERVGRSHVVYVDTDGLIVDNTGRRRLMSLLGDELGDLRIEIDAAERAIIHGLKSYEIGSLKRSKGIPRSAKRDGQTITYESWPTMTGLIGSGSLSEYRVRTVTRRVSSDYTKGIVGRTGRVRPLTIDTGGAQ